MKIMNNSNLRIEISMEERVGYDTEEPFDLDPGEIGELLHLENGNNNSDGADTIIISIIKKKKTYVQKGGVGVNISKKLIPGKPGDKIRFK